MKTLDEVINALEICGHDESPKCPYFDTEHWCCCEDHMRSIYPLKNDALEYLKKLKRIEAKIEKIAIGNVEDTLSKIDNPPLTWQELQQMEGKPVWFEYDNHLSGRKQNKYKVWDVIDLVAEDLILVKGEFCYQKDEFGDIWHAYRKERS